ncbi:3-phosphoshikimate 1-carboxyvinyltransferase [Brachyspira hyodysenteriae]|uniref:3-phosphoshikimate 1-carboxyvinyltransferase n=3 Tax=Brachyspira hyodysenteriae TaxID=159 RepID=AROA_BRAHW|nr:3-phosphoshikimate 1-carboxyvinyltransferase [Brachyspira hyodysenteriae]C0QZK3.1 RecName: Full=3-phosphoshikimate 1-carboxyvinyltransferase; AltName: Full=5-enolpyruvylshikimate-3-phosphate synthase; Short=EPSP synthase; Short=EPSPS [Brachyspira hyodysenteriae WA1]ACN83291.1 3-phosphoshikimate 1-carboxyvinyltransferase [Brachyspira hyodysenteriae WA1]ANN64557.1 3-phosphoshikimate 1-carboxyvinyltransferase [Brachyspira hyodysenteriae ATCC 27164]AUJ49032.1 3-phosphoshikimate 1-carboxyvinyltra
MTLTIKPSEIFGSIYIQMSKSDAHRALIASSLAKTPSIIKRWIDNVSVDVEVTKNAVSNFADLEIIDDNLKVFPKKEYKKELVIDVKESGSSLRFLIPIMSAFGITCTFTGSKKLFSRPIDVYKKIWKEEGLEFIHSEDSIKISGQLKASNFKVLGNLSSQFLSGLLFALPLLDGNSNIIIDGELESEPYVMMTLKTLKAANIETLRHDNNIIEVYGNQEYSGIDYEVESDWSHAAFFAAAGALGGETTLYGLNKYSIQGDKEILNILKFMGASVSYNDDNSITIKKTNRLNALDIDMSDIPDLGPIITTLAATAKGRTRLYNAGRLRYKESDRMNDLMDSFSRIGANIEVSEDEILIEGVERLKGGNTTSHNDHRIAMALAVASAVSDNDIIIDDAESINKSSFNFIEQFRSIGAKVVS